jgi:hypothetical protein
MYANLKGPSQGLNEHRLAIYIIFVRKGLDENELFAKSIMKH